MKLKLGLRRHSGAPVDIMVTADSTATVQDIARAIIRNDPHSAQLARSDDGAVTLLEWGEVVLPALPGARLDIRLVHGEDDDVRTIHLQPSGRPWAHRADALAGILSRWASA